MIQMEMRFQGETYDHARDGKRLNTLLTKVRAAMQKEDWVTLAYLAKATGGSEASVSARLRDLRKPEFGGHTIERRYVRNGLHAYRMRKTP